MKPQATATLDNSTYTYFAFSVIVSVDLIVVYIWLVMSLASSSSLLSPASSQSLSLSLSFPWYHQFRPAAFRALAHTLTPGCMWGTRHHTSRGRERRQTEMREGDGARDDYMKHISE